jgi:hypothetical protein
MEWYIKKGVALNLKHFAIRAVDSGDWPTEFITQDEFMGLLHAKIDQINLDRVRDDIVRFIPDQKVVAVWSPKYFHDLVDHLRFAT